MLTPTEAAGVGAFGAFLISLFRGKLSFANIKESLLATGKTTAMIFLIIIGAEFISSGCDHASNGTRRLCGRSFIK